MALVSRATLNALLAILVKDLMTLILDSLMA
jgi:hypothetical protein